MIASGCSYLAMYVASSSGGQIVANTRNTSKRIITEAIEIKSDLLIWVRA